MWWKRAKFDQWDGIRLRGLLTPRGCPTRSQCDRHVCNGETDCTVKAHSRERIKSAAATATSKGCTSSSSHVELTADLISEVFPFPSPAACQTKDSSSCFPIRPPDNNKETNMYMGRQSSVSSIKMAQSSIVARGSYFHISSIVSFTTIQVRIDHEVTAHSHSHQQCRKHGSNTEHSPQIPMQKSTFTRVNVSPQKRAA